MHRPSIRLPDRRLLGGFVIGVLVGVIGVGAVTAADPAGAPAGRSSVGTAAPFLRPQPGPWARLAALRSAVRANFRVDVTATNRDGTRALLYVRGAIEIGTGSISVTLPDASTQAFTVDAMTVVREKGQTISLEDLHAGDQVMVFGTKDTDGSYTAGLIACVVERAPDGAGASGSPAP